jgi:DNA replication and repair protein RecF
MHLKNLRLQNFRNHINSTFEFNCKTNVLLGNNGHGKTNVIEAISYACLTKSFYANSDSIVLNFGNSLFEIDSTIISEQGQEIKIRVAYSEPQQDKVYTFNNHRVEPFSSIVGKFPLVICSPEHSPVTSSGPSERRKFVDFVISQSNNSYFQNLLEYRRILKQRNKILMDGKISHHDVLSLLAPWNEQLIERGSYLILKRKQFIDEFKCFVQSAYQQIADENEKPSIEYKPMNVIGEFAGQQEIQSMLQRALQDKSREEIKMGTTMVGPHRDEFVFTINNLDLRKYASQGQHKTFLIALKIGEFYYLKERCQETPVMLLDDIFSELDENRAQHLLNYVDALSQTFITTTNPHLFKEDKTSRDGRKVFYISDGKVEEKQAIST